MQQYFRALRVLKWEYFPDSSWPVFLANEFYTRMLHGSWAVTGSIDLIKDGGASMIPGYVKHRLLDVVHPWGSERAA